LAVSDKKALIKRYVALEPAELDPANARLRETGVPVWALVGYHRAVDGDADRVAADYELPREAVEAALAFYKQHRAAIDARLSANAA
jgi:uncharacterized protein (DUF433 family)